MQYDGNRNSSAYDELIGLSFHNRRPAQQQVTELSEEQLR